MTRNQHFVSSAMALFCLAVAPSAACSYSASLDSVSLSGVTDNFDDGVLAPWFAEDPTVVETGGFAVFTNPGTKETIDVGAFNVRTEFSYITYGSVIANGFGDFVGESVWAPVIPEMNQMIGGGFFESGTNGEQDIAVIHLYNFDDTIANGLGIPAGFGALGAIADGSGDLSIVGISLNPVDLVGNVHLTLEFTDSTDAFTGFVSLDGGSTRSQVFGPSVVTWSVADSHQGTESWRVPSPPPVLLIAPVLVSLLARRSMRPARKA